MSAVVGGSELRARLVGAKMTAQPAAAASNGAENAVPPGERLPHRLDTASRVRREMARVYRLARPLAGDVADYSRLSNMLHMLHRAIESGELEKRIEALEQRASP